MAERLLETDFPLIPCPNPPSWAEAGRNGSLRRAYSSEQLAGPTLQPSPDHSSDTSDCLSEDYQLLQHRPGPHFPTKQRPTFRPPRQRPVEEEQKLGCGTRCSFSILFLGAQLLLHAAVSLTVYWVLRYRWSGQGSPFAWPALVASNSSTLPAGQAAQLELQWNLHPVLMLGFIYNLCQGMLVYRACRCCRRLTTKLFHAAHHLLAVPCLAVGFLAVWDYHALRQPAPIPHFYSIHSWLGLLVAGLFCLQFLVGVFSFLVLLCCESSTADCRARLVPLHATIGTVTFFLAVAAAVAGFAEKAFFDLGLGYPAWVSFLAGTNSEQSSADKAVQSIIINSVAGSLALLAVILPTLLWYPAFRHRPHISP